jgi:hypothetical protein
MYVRLPTKTGAGVFRTHFALSRRRLTSILHVEQYLIGLPDPVNVHVVPHNSQL